MTLSDSDSQNKIKQEPSWVEKYNAYDASIKRVNKKKLRISQKDLYDLSTRKISILTSNKP